ncbi:MAG: choice-of-anchor tandem repeat NxxGxxAF-containing protein [Nostoc sp.]
MKSAYAGTFTFTKIAEADNKNFIGVGVGGINDNGTVVFAADTPSVIGTGLFTGNGEAISQVIKPSRLNGFNGAEINNSGTIGFGKILPKDGLFISNGKTVITVATPSDGLSVGQVVSNAFNNNNTLVFTLNTFDNPVIATSSGGSFTTVVDTSGQFSFFDQPPVINDNNVVAFSAVSKKDVSQGLYTIQNGLVTTIADADETSPFLGGFFDFSINNRNAVGFTATLKSGEEGVFIGNGKTITTVANTSGTFSEFFDLRINNNNQIAFNGILDNGTPNVFADGIFTGSDPIADKVIGIGDSLFGGTVTNVFFAGGLNNLGQIAFMATIKDSNNISRDFIFRADPVSTSVPESTSILGLLALGTLGTGLTLKSNLK